MYKPAPGPCQCRHIHVQALTKALVAVETQTLGIGNRHQEQVQRQRLVVAQLDVVVAHKALVNPAKPGREVPDSAGANRLFVDHGHLHPGARTRGVHRAPTVASCGPPGLCHLYAEQEIMPSIGREQLSRCRFTELRLGIVSLARLTQEEEGKMSMSTVGYCSFTSTLRRWRGGPLGSYIDEFTALLEDQGYSHASIRKALQIISVFSRWLYGRYLSASDVNEHRVQQFLRYRQRTLSVQRGQRAALMKMAGLLCDMGVVQITTKPMILSARECVEQDFCDYILQYRGLSASTLRCYLPFRFEISQRAIWRWPDPTGNAENKRRNGIRPAPCSRS